MEKKVSLKKLFASILPGAAVALVGSFMLFFYAPFELYLTNHMEFWYTSGQMMPVVLCMFFGAFAFLVILLLICRRINENLYAVVVALGFAAVLALYVQGNFLVKNLPGLDGTEVNWSAYPAERIKSLLVWLIALVLVAVMLKLLGKSTFGNVAGLASLALGLVLTITVGTLFLTVNETEKSNLPVATDRDMFRMSEDRNLVVLVLDAIDGCEFENIIYSNEEYMELFRDFTFYDNAMSGYPYSDCSEALYLTGEWYNAEMPSGEYMKQAAENSPFFNALEKEGYSTGLYITSNFFLAGISADEFVNLTDEQPGIRSQGFMAKLILKMAAVKYAPWDLKFFGYDLLGRQNENKAYAGGEGCDYFDWTNIAFYSRIKDENPISLTEEPVARVIHLDGAHVPIRYDKFLNIVDDATYQSGIEGSLFLVARYAECLKEAGIYDNTAIVVMSDHGYAAKEYPQLNTMQQHPIFLAKGFGESHSELKIDNAPISYEDLPDAFVSLMEGAAGDSIFQWSAGDVRERRFMVYEWTNLNYFEEYVQTGQAEDMNTFVPTGRVFEYAG